MTLIYPVDAEVILEAPRDVLEVVVLAVEAHAPLVDSKMQRQLRLFANSLRAHAQHLPRPEQTEEWLDT